MRMICKGRLSMDLIIDAVLDSIKLLPFLFLVYLVIAYFESNTENKLYQKLMNAKWSGPFMGALIGCVPQCGFSVVGANLYSKKMIGIGTLLAIFISTSDEAIPILIAHPNMLGMVGVVLVLKVVFAIAIGLAVESISYILAGKKVVKIANATESVTYSEVEMVQGSCGCGHHHHHIEDKSFNIWVEAFRHTVKTFLFILAVNLVLNGIIEGVGEEAMASILLTDSVFQPALAGLIGLIPNCASSIILTEMFVAGTLSLGSLIAGLCTGAGIGLVVLFKSNKNIIDNLKILGILYVTGTVFGMMIQFIR